MTSPGKSSDSARPPRTGREEPDYTGYNAGIAVFSYIVGGIIVWSLVGWALDILLGTHWIVLAGAFVGLAGGFYLTAKHNFFRATDAEPGSPDSGTKGRQ